ncbi:YncE family protein [Chryseobacterium scophthalmum]|uniref:40-residue YVTN family beta-propeller repeat-containing protein n=1 Tax=Chryseobacterium scophthalmum TaxID=59733 RepID=A0A1N6EKR2_9FLAO|nr:YncE family protein [Chryseobacterium scophthalmum]SIN83598.1 40-residue YVTN family beta-propeller repeat-containing protein [Chryseobacterium scophthalmum]
MKNLIFGLPVALLATLFTSCSSDDYYYSDSPKIYEEKVVVANRGAGSVSFIDATSNQVSTLAISGSEPMYVVYVPTKDKIFVGDRAGKKVHIINPQTKAVESSITVGNGVFHMWADGMGKQLWVSNDIDNTISVIDLNTNTVVKTINVGMKPHDVFLSKDATKAYVSVFNVDAAMPDKVYMYSTSDYSKTGEANVGKDPHLYHLPNTNKLFVACQSGQVYALNGSNLTVISNNAFTGAHGIFPSADQNTVFVTNITGQQLYSINAATGMQNGMPLMALSTTPHNIVVNEDGNKMFVTHSGGTATAVSTYTISGTSLTAGTTITAGTNPFGLAYYKREVK